MSKSILDNQLTSNSDIGDDSNDPSQWPNHYNTSHIPLRSFTKFTSLKLLTFDIMPQSQSAALTPWVQLLDQFYHHSSSRNLKIVRLLRAPTSVGQNGLSKEGLDIGAVNSVLGLKGVFASVGRTDEEEWIWRLETLETTEESGKGDEGDVDGDDKERNDEE
jgi:hypothetical protein